MASIEPNNHGRAEVATGIGDCKERVTGAARKALKAQGLPVPCSTVSHIQSCKKTLPEKDTFERIKELTRNFDKLPEGQTGLEALSNAAQTALDEGADIGDVIDAFAMKTKAPLGYETPIGGAIRSGLHPQISDGTRNSAHIFAYIRYSYWSGKDVALAANEIHDPPLEWEIKGSPSGISKEDYVAGLKGASIGEKIARGEICLEDFGDFLKSELGSNDKEIPQLNEQAEKHLESLRHQDLIRKKMRGENSFDS